MRRQRDNLKALAEGSATVPVAERLTPGSWKPPTAASQTQILAHQGTTQWVLAGASFTFFNATVVVAGVYTIAGTRPAAVTTIVYKNGVSELNPGSGAFTHQMTLASGDNIRVELVAIGDGGLQDYRFLSEYAVPMAQCWFSRYPQEEPD
jgi:hypothetical protein